MQVILIKNHKILVDEEDFKKVSAYTWTITRGKYTSYAIATINGKTTSMHSLILNTSEGFVSDHIDGNGLNNQKKNLRQATHSQNASNRQGPNRNNKSSGLRGVYPIYKNKKFTGYWKAKLGSAYLGYFSTPEEAAAAYNKAAREKYKDFSGKLNFE